MSQREGWRAHWPLLAVSALIIMTVAQHTLWLSQATAIETWDDDAGLYRLATCLEDQVRGQGGACFAGAPYPPLIPAIAAMHFVVTGARGLDMALWSLWPWLVVLGLALWVGVRKAAGTWAALAAVALGPAVLWSLHIRGKFYTEVPLAALGVAAIVAWVHSERFRGGRASILLGSILGLGLLAKWSFAFFLGPPMAMAWAIGLASTLRDKRAQALVAAGVLGAITLLAVGASGRLLGGLWPGTVLGVVIAGGTAFMAQARPNALADDGRTRLKHLAWATAAVLVVAGPWYLTHLGALQAFLADNMAQKFHGDPIGPLAGSGFYPAVLLTRVASTPLAALLVLGSVMSLRKDEPALSRWCLLALASGTLILGVLPYRSGRYLVAGLGLVAPIAVLGLARLPKVGRIGAITVMAAGILHQLSWIPLGAGALHVPHHWPIFTLPEQDLFGNSRQGIAQANSDLIHPRWRFLPVASPPVDRPVAARALVQATAADAPGPFLLVVLDPAGRVNANSLETELLSTRPSPLSSAISGDIQASAASLAHWTHQARNPPDSPATAHGDSSRWLYIGTASPTTDPSGQSRVDDLVRTLKTRGWEQVMSLTIEDPFEPTTISLWSEPR